MQTWRVFTESHIYYDIYVTIMERYGLSNKVHCEYLPKETKIMLHQLLISQQGHLNAAVKQSTSVIKMSKHTHSEGFRIQLHSKCFERLKIKLYMYLLNNFSSTSIMSKSSLTMFYVLNGLVANCLQSFLGVYNTKQY